MRYESPKEQTRADEIFDNAMRMGLMHGEEPMRAMARELAQLEGYRDVNTKRLQEHHELRAKIQKAEADLKIERLCHAKDLRVAEEEYQIQREAFKTERDNARELVRLFKALRQPRSHGMVLVQAEIMKRAPSEDEYDRIMKRISFAQDWAGTFLEEVERLDNV